MSFFWSSNKTTGAERYPKLEDRIKALPEKDQRWLVDTFDGLHQDFQNANAELESKSHDTKAFDALALIPHGTLHRNITGSSPPKNPQDAQGNARRSFKFENKDGYFFQPKINRRDPIDPPMVPSRKLHHAETERPQSRLQSHGPNTNTRLKIVVPDEQMRKERSVQYLIIGAPSRPKTAPKNEPRGNESVL